LGIDAHRKIDGETGRHDLVAAVRVLVVEIGLVLERIGLQIAGIQRRVGNHIIGEFDDLNVETVLRGDRFDGFEDLGMGPGRDADLDGFAAGCARDSDQGGRRDDEIT
jgi:hypothetical protein